MPNLIRWRDDGLWPPALECIPPEHHVLTDRDEADARFQHYLTHSVSARVSRTFSQMWRIAMDAGYQPNGLVLCSLLGLSTTLGVSTMPSHDFGRWVQDNDLWRRVPGKLYPYGGKEHIPGSAHRAYLVLGGTCDWCHIPRKLRRG